MSFKLTNELFQSARTIVREGQIKRSLEVKVTGTGAVTDTSDKPLDILPLGNQGDHCVTEINFHLPTELQDGYYGYFLVDLENEIYIQKCEMLTEDNEKIANAWIEEKITFNKNKELNCLFVAIEADLDSGDNITEETEIFVTDEFYGAVQDNFLTSGWHAGVVVGDDIAAGDIPINDPTPGEDPTEYEPMVWVNGETKLNAENMNNIMLGIDEAHERLDKTSLFQHQSQVYGGEHPLLLKYNENKLYLFFDKINSEVSYKVSNDGGNTWSEAVDLFTTTTETRESGRLIQNIRHVYAFLSPNNDGRIVVVYPSFNTNTPYFSICARVSDTNGENFGARQELFYSTSGYWEPFYYKGWIYYSYEHDGSGSDKAQSIYRRTLSVDLNGVITVGSGTKFLDGRNKIDTDGNVNNKTRLDMISAAPVEDGHIFVFESSVNANASTPRPMVVQYCYVEHPENNPSSPTSVVNLFLGSSGKSCGAPFVTTLDDGRIVISFQTDVASNAPLGALHRKRFVVFVSKRKVKYNDSLTADDFVKLTTYGYAKYEYSVWGSISNIDGILYKTFNICGEENNFDNYHNYQNINLVQTDFQYDYPKLWTDIKN